MFGLVLVAVLVRALLITSFLTRFPDLYLWGTNEVGVVGRSLFLSHSFSSPYHDAYGPTAWLAPVYPAIVAAIFAIFGVQTPASAIAAIVVNALCSALVSVVLYKMGSELFGEAVGIAAGLLCAVSPAVSLIALLVWDTCLSTLLATCACWLTLRLACREPGQRWISWASAGALWGVAGLSSPSVLAPMPFLVLWLWLKTKRIKLAGTFAGSLITILVPWTLRNLFVFHRLVPVRDNFWADMYWGNVGFGTHPLGKSMEYQRLGELPFIELCKQRLLLYLHDHFAEFARQTLHRIGNFWILPEGWWGLSFFLTAGTVMGVYLMARRKHPAAFPLSTILLVFPVTYYVSYTFSRYRHPIEPIMYLISAFVLVELGQRVGGVWRRFTR